MGTVFFLIIFLIRPEPRKVQNQNIQAGILTSGSIY